MRFEMGNRPPAVTTLFYLSRLVHLASHTVQSRRQLGLIAHELSGSGCLA